MKRSRSESKTAASRRHRRRQQDAAYDTLFNEIDTLDRETVEETVRRYYPAVLDKDMLDDPWPLHLDERGTLRWKEDPMVSHLMGSHIDTLVPGDRMDPARARAVNDICPLNLTKLAVAVYKGYYDRKNYRKLMKRIGYSLQGYYELDDVWPDEDEEDASSEIVVV